MAREPMSARYPSSGVAASPAACDGPARGRFPPAGPSVAALSFLAALLAAGPLAPRAWAAQDDLRLEVARQWAEKGEYEKAVQELRLFLNEHPESAEVYARIGSLRLRQGRLQQAAENFQVALRKNPDLAEAREGMAKVQRLEARPGAEAAPEGAPGTAGASESADAPPSPEAEAAAPSGIYALAEFQQALRQYREKQSEQALATLKRVLAKSPGHPGAYYLGGVIRYEKGELDKAAYNFQRSFAYPERGFNAHFYLGRIRQRQGRIPEAVEHFQKYLAATRNEAGRKQVERILAQLKAVPERPPEHVVAPAGKPAASPAAPGNPAQAHKAPDRPASPAAAPGPAAKPAEGAAHDASRAGAMDPAREPHSHDANPHEPPAGAAPRAEPVPPPERAPAPLVLSLEGAPPFVVADSAGASGRMLREAHAAFTKEKFEKSADLLKEVIRQFGGSPNAEAADLDLAAVYLRLGLWDNARDRILSYLSSARQPQRYRDLAFYLEGLMHLGRKDGAKAERALLKVKAGAFGGPAQDEIDWRLAQAGELMQDVKKWSAYLEKAHASARTVARKARLSQQLGLLHGRHGRPERALEQYRKALAHCGKPAGEEGDGGGELAELCREARLRVADLEFRRRNWQAALEGYRKFAAEFPDHAETAWAQYQIANVYQATRNLESALNQYRKVIDNYPGSYWASQARWKREDAIWRKEYEEVLD